MVQIIVLALAIALSVCTGVATQHPQHGPCMTCSGDNGIPPTPPPSDNGGGPGG